MKLIFFLVPSIALHLVVLERTGFTWASGERVWANCSALEA